MARSTTHGCGRTLGVFTVFRNPSNSRGRDFYQSRPPSCSIHPSAWKVDSATFCFIGLSEVRPIGMLSSSLPASSGLEDADCRFLAIVVWYGDVEPPQLGNKQRRTSP